MKDFRQLKVWEKAHALTLEAYRTTRTFPSEEKFGLSSQIRRGSASIAANLAEGCGRGTGRDFLRFVQIGMGSAVELDYHFLLSKDLGFLEQNKHSELQAMVTELRRMLASLIRKVEAELA